ncbi:RNA polymerase sigma factor [Salinibacterium sp. ZJ450]|uniref:RNA polymerase sigma factor n=1 Tax=Salinibacterium sp. ZJ450 TaxID=2708338 RepID=UPI00141E9AE9|nr:sigma-70 family RNA polymerase sigma factor [Salinibacterium sp. ZJ450]
MTRPSQPAVATRLTELILSNAPDLLAYFTRRVTPVEDAADLLSETMLVTWRHIRSLPADDERARMWMFGTARRVLANHRRGSKRKSALADRLRDELVVNGPTSSVADGIAEEVRQAVSDLPPVLGEVVSLVHWEGFTLVEVSLILDTSASTVRSRYAKARQILHSRLSERSTGEVVPTTDPSPAYS